MKTSIKTHKTIHPCTMRMFIFVIASLAVFVGGSIPFTNGIFYDSGIANATTTTTPTPSLTPAPSNACTKPASTPTPTDQKLLTGVINKIKDKLSDTSKSLFTSITSGKGYMGTLRAGMTLYIVIYGILFMAGIAEIKFHDFIIHLTKLAIVGILLSSGSWEFFSGTVVKFFNDGTDSIINEINKITLGSYAGPPPKEIGADTTTDSTQGAFAALDTAINKAISSDMIKTFLASIPVNLYGILFSGLLITSLFIFAKAVMQAAWVYIMSLAMRTLLFGLAPIFIPFILFQRTKHLFDGWLNQVISTSLLPILLFVFMSFFVHLMDASMSNIMKTPVSWSTLDESVRGAPFEIYFYRFMESDGAGGCRPKTGADSLQEGFPIDIVAILTFMILAYLASSFNNVVVQISREISSAGANLAASNPLADVMGKVVGGGGEGGLLGRRRR